MWLLNQPQNVWLISLNQKWSSTCFGRFGLPRSYTWGNHLERRNIYLSSSFQSVVIALIVLFFQWSWWSCSLSLIGGGIINSYLWVYVRNSVNVWCMWLCVCVYLCMFLTPCVYVCEHMHMCVCVWLCVSAGMFAWVHACVYGRVCYWIYVEVRGHYWSVSISGSSFAEHRTSLKCRKPPVSSLILLVNVSILLHITAWVQGIPTQVLVFVQQVRFQDYFASSVGEIS